MQTPPEVLMKESMETLAELYWLTECTLATVGSMTHLKSKNGKSEHRRQIGLAQRAIDHIRTHTPYEDNPQREYFHYAMRRAGNCSRVDCVLDKYKGRVENWVTGSEE